MLCPAAPAQRLVAVGCAACLPHDPTWFGLPRYVAPGGGGMFTVGAWPPKPQPPPPPPPAPDAGGQVSPDDAPASAGGQLSPGVDPHPAVALSPHPALEDDPHCPPPVPHVLSTGAWPPHPCAVLPAQFGGVGGRSMSGGGPSIHYLQSIDENWDYESYSILIRSWRRALAE